MSKYSGITFIDRGIDTPITIVRGDLRMIEMGNSTLSFMRTGIKCNDRMFNSPVKIVGQEYITLVPPILLTGPTATPAPTSCTIRWTTNIPAYHRVRYRRSDSMIWIESGWCAEFGTNAEVLIFPLDSENVEYIYDVQSCVVGDGSMAFPYYPGDDSAIFYTLCVVPSFYNNSVIAISGGMRYTWNTNVLIRENARIKDLTAGSGWKYIGDNQFRTSHSADHVISRYYIRDHHYEWQGYGANACGTVCFSIAWHFWVDAGGQPNPET